MDVEAGESMDIHSLIAFYPMWWYSAWSAMVRFLELANALFSSYEEK